MGTLTFANIDYVSRQLATGPRPCFVIFDLRRVAAITRPAGRLLAEGIRELAAFNVTAILSGIERSSPAWKPIGEWTDGISNLRNYRVLDDAIEWAEDQIVYRHGGAIDFHEMTDLAEQPLLAGLSAQDLTDLTRLGAVRRFEAGTIIITASAPPVSLFFLKSGAVHVRLPDGTRVATLTAGTALAKWRCWKRIAPPRWWRTNPSPRLKCRWPIFSAFANSIRGSANASCAIWRNCSPTA